MADKINSGDITEQIKQAIKEEFQYKASQGKPIYTMEEVIYIVNEVIDEVKWENNDNVRKIKSEDFIKAFGEGVKQMKNVKPIVIDCKHYLQCGLCDKTGQMCSQLCGIELNTDNTPNYKAFQREICIIKGDMKYLCDKIDTLSKLIENPTEK